MIAERSASPQRRRTMARQVSVDPNATAVGRRLVGMLHCGETPVGWSKSASGGEEGLDTITATGQVVPPGFKTVTL